MTGALALVLVVLDPGGEVALDASEPAPVERVVDWTDGRRTHRLSVWVVPMTDGAALVELETGRVRHGRFRGRRRESHELTPGARLVARPGGRRAVWEVRLQISQEVPAPNPR